MKVCVYCSAKDSIADKYKQLGVNLGQWIAAEGHTLVFGGATGGLMTAVSKSAIDAGGEVVGVIPNAVENAGRLSPYCTELVKVKTMSERKQRMKDEADCFVCLPGSYGTLDEMFDVIASGTVGEHHKPIFILNYEEFYEPLRMEIKHMKNELFIPQRESYVPRFVDSLEDLYERLGGLKK